MKALEDIVLLDLTHMLSGPYGAMLLTDLGAQTIKVEPRAGAKGPEHCRPKIQRTPSTEWAHTF